MAVQRFTTDGRRVYEPDGAVLTEAFWHRGRFSVIPGPVGSGTSTMLSHKIWAIANEQEPDYDGVRRTRFVVTRETYPQLRKTFIETWQIWFPEEKWGQMVRSEPMQHVLRDKHWSDDGTKVECDVVFLAIPSPEAAEALLASFEITGFVQNEMQFTQRGITTELLSRVGRYPSMMNGPGASWYGGFGDMNAPVEGHWIPYMRGDIPIPRDLSEAEKDDLVKPDEWDFFVQPPGLIETVVEGKIQYQPNPKAENQRWLKVPYIQRIRGWDKDRIDRRVMNKVSLAKGGKPVYPTYMEAEHASPLDLEPIDGFKIIVGLDFGREPAAVFGQDINGSWRVISELIGSNESAALFAPRVARHLAEFYPGMEFVAYGDPRGADKGQNDEKTAYDHFRANGITVIPATRDNNVQMRRAAVETVLGRRNGIKIGKRCLMFRTGLNGGYHYKKIQGLDGLYSPKPLKNAYSHVVEAGENMLLGGGEGSSTSQRSGHKRKKPSPARRPSIRDRKRA